MVIVYIFTHVNKKLTNDHTMIKQLLILIFRQEKALASYGLQNLLPTSTTSPADL